MTSSSIVHLSAPISLRVAKSTAKSLLLEWQRPAIVRHIPLSSGEQATSDASSSTTLYYAVSWQPKHMDRKREVNTTETSMLVDDLAADTVYLVNVCAIMSAKKGPYSFLEAKTSVDTQVSSPPLDFRFEILVVGDQDQEALASDTKIRFKWRKPATNTDQVLKYRLYYQHVSFGSHSASQSKTDGVESSSESYQFFPSLKDEDYDAQVCVIRVHLTGKSRFWYQGIFINFRVGKSMTIPGTIYSFNEKLLIYLSLFKHLKKNGTK